MKVERGGGRYRRNTSVGVKVDAKGGRLGEGGLPEAEACYGFEHSSVLSSLALRVSGLPAVVELQTQQSTRIWTLLLEGGRLPRGHPMCRLRQCFDHAAQLAPASPCLQYQAVAWC